MPGRAKRTRVRVIRAAISQGDVLAHMSSELIAASSEKPPPELGQNIRQALDDAQQMEMDIIDKKPVRNGDLISDFDNLASLCGQLRSSNDVVAP
jgi:hypothetical protein